ncbi:ABC transporter permease [Streptomyces iranensis]|uniref:ABC transporter permease n=1 Tax=Streptomyces iranensis TaxID=576784 RepID=UPI0039B7351D
MSPVLEPVVPLSARRRTVPRWLRRTTGPLLLLVLWQVSSATGVLPSDTLASPGTIADTASGLLKDGTLPHAMLVSVQRVLIGLALGGVIGVSLALISGLSRLGEDLVDASVQMLRSIPWVGMIPLFIIWMGIGEAPKIALIALGVTFHLYLNTRPGGVPVGIAAFLQGSVVQRAVIPQHLAQRDRLTGRRAQQELIRTQQNAARPPSPVSPGQRRCGDSTGHH